MSVSVCVCVSVGVGVGVGTGVGTGVGGWPDAFVGVCSSLIMGPSWDMKIAKHNFGN